MNWAAWTALLALVLPCNAWGRDVPEDIAVRAFARPEATTFHLLLRVPLRALNGVDFPSRPGTGDLDLTRAAALLPSTARWWIADYIDLSEKDTLLPKPQVMAARISLPSDNAFDSWDDAWKFSMS